MPNQANLLLSSTRPRHTLSPGIGEIEEKDAQHTNNCPRTSGVRFVRGAFLIAPPDLLVGNEAMRVAFLDQCQYSFSVE